MFSTSTTRSVPSARAGPLLVTVRVDVIDVAAPGVTVSGSLALVRDRSAPSASTWPLTEAVLLPAWGSVELPAIVAVLVKAPADAGAVATMSMSSFAPAGIVGRVQLTVWPAATQVQFGPPEAETKIQPAGSTSVTDTSVAAAGPALRGVRRKVTGEPAAIGVPEAMDLVVSCRSAMAPVCGLTVVFWVWTLLVGSVSASAVRVAVALTSNTLAETSALQTAVMVRVPPLATDPSSQTTRVALVAAQLPAGEAAAETNDAPPGTSRVSRAFVAASPPLLLTTTT